MDVDKPTITRHAFNKQSLEALFQDEYVARLFPVVYIIFDEKKMQAYIGETTNVPIRLATHLKHPKKNKLKKVYVISCEQFNKSAVLDIEANLIQCLPALEFKLFNGNGGIIHHNYYQKQIYLEQFSQIWQQLSFDKVQPKTLSDIKNSDLFKYSPYKALNYDQYTSAIEILNILVSGKKKSLFVDGIAGTGKTILAIYLIKLLSDIHRYDIDDFNAFDENLRDLLVELKNKYPKDKYPNGLQIALVVPMTSLRSTLKKVFRSIQGLTGAMVISPYDVVKKPYDLLLVDESHRLCRRTAIINYDAYDKVNKKLGIDGTQLDWIMQSSSQQLFFYDAAQSIKPADVRKVDFDALRAQLSSTEVKLVSQLRCRGGKDYIVFVDKLLNNKLPANTQVFSNKDYELILFDSIQTLITQLQRRENEYGLCRTTAGYAWEWVSSNQPDTPDAIIEGVKFTWNRDTNDWIHSTTDLQELGCIHTTQGYDLNYVGIIFGRDIRYDKINQRITTHKNNYFDTKGKSGIQDPQELHDYIINIYKTLMYRGISGTYVYACDPDLREYFAKVMVKM
ncbi:MAG: DNA/RNA helicase domain-containing protein [Cellvibrionaceae bacterium]